MPRRRFRRGGRRRRPVRKFHGRGKRQNSFRKKRFRKKGGVHTKVKSIGSRGSTFHRVKFGRRSRGLQKLMKKLSSRNQYSSGVAGLTGASAGNQETATWKLCTKTQLQNFAATMSQAGTGADGDVNNTKRWILNKQYTVLRMTNLSSANMTCWLGFWLTKKDHSTYDVISTWDSGLEDEDAFAANNDFTVVGNVPFNNVKTNTWYKCLKVVHFQLLPGEEHIEHIKYNVNKVIQNEILYGDLSCGEYIGGLTIDIVLCIYGSLGLDAVTAAVTTAPVKMGWNMTQDSYFGYLSDNDYNYTSLYAMSEANNAINIYNQGSGAFGAAATV